MILLQGDDFEAKGCTVRSHRQWLGRGHREAVRLLILIPQGSNMEANTGIWNWDYNT